MDHLRKLGEQEARSHLHDRLFHGLKKNLKDSLRYQHDDPRIHYSQLVAVRKAESESDAYKTTNSTRTKAVWVDDG